MGIQFPRIPTNLPSVNALQQRKPFPSNGTAGKSSQAAAPPPSAEQFQQVQDMTEKLKATIGTIKQDIPHPPSAEEIQQVQNTLSQIGKPTQAAQAPQATKATPDLPSAEQLQQLTDNADKLRQAPPQFSTTVINTPGGTDVFASTPTGNIHARNFSQDNKSFFTDLNTNVTYEVNETKTGDNTADRVLTDTSTGQQITHHVRYGADGSYDADTNNDGVFETHIAAAVTPPEPPSTSAA